MAPDNLKCPECREVFKKPKYLPCYHYYCEQCLEKMQVQSKIRCPNCRKETRVPPGGVKDLDDNFFINHSVDEFIVKHKVESGAEVKCDECSEEDPAVTFCSECTIFLCHVCNEHHKRSNKFHGHDIIPLTELRSKKDAIQLKPKPMMCKEHGTELFFYCETCDQLVCIYCIVKNHIFHNHDIVEKIVDKHKQELKKISAPIEEMIRGLSDTYGNVERVMKKILQQGDKVNKKIDQHYDRVIQKLMEQKEQLKQQVHDMVSQKFKAVTTQLEELEYAQAKVLSMKELNDAVEKCSDQEVLSLKKQVIDRMQKITDKYNLVDFPPVQPDIMKFVPNNDVLPQFGLVCSTASPDPHNCEVVDFPKYCIKGKKTKFTIITKDTNGDRCSGGSQISVQLGGVNDTIQVRDNNDGSYMASVIPQQVGEVKLPVLLCGEHIKGSPYSVIVKDYTSIKKCSKIVNTDGTMGKPWGIAFGKNGIWAVADYSKHLVYVFDSGDQLVRMLGGHGSDNSQFCYPAGVAFDSDGCLYVVDSANHRVQKFTLDGEHLLKFGHEGSEEGKLKFPNGLTIYSGKAYVSDHGNNRISVFETDGKFNCTFGSVQLGKPHDITVNGNQLLIADHVHHCIYTFTPDGKYVGKFGTRGSGVAQLDNPFGVSVDLYGFILVVDTWNHRVSIYDKDGVFINCFGSMGSAIGQFRHPYGIAVSANGNIYVSDHSNKRIQIFSN